MKKIVHLVGTRPQYIKLFPLWSLIEENSTVCQKVYDTGQHYDEHMSQRIIAEFGITGVETGIIKGLMPEEQIPKMIENLWSYLTKESPDYVFIYGDTNSTLAAAIACSKLGVAFGHVEAGVRTAANVGIQEGINRKVADILSTDNYCVTQMDYSNLINSIGCDTNCHLVGDLMYDAFRKVEGDAGYEDGIHNTVLVTLHRAENVDVEHIRASLVDSIVDLANSYEVILPLHPRLRKHLSESQLQQLEVSKITLTDPLTYSEVVSVLGKCVGVITDSGGLPKDASFAGVPAIVLRSDPIWHDLSDMGYIKAYGDVTTLTSSDLLQLAKSHFDRKLPKFEMDLAAPAIFKALNERF